MVRVLSGALEELCSQLHGAGFPVHIDPAESLQTEVAAARRSAAGQSVVWSIGDLYRELPSIDWNAYLGRLFAGRPPQSFAVPDAMPLYELSSFLETSPAGTIQRAVTIAIVMALLPAMPAAVVQAYNANVAALLGAVEPLGDADACRRLLISPRGSLGWWAYRELSVRLVRDRKCRRCAALMARDVAEKVLRAWLEGSEGHSAWMDRRTRLASMRKALDVELLVGSPLWIHDDTELAGWYDGLDVDDDAGLVSALLQLWRLSALRGRERLYRAQNRSAWAEPDFGVEPRYRAELNQLVLPAGLLRPMTVPDEYPLAYIFGVTGTAIARQLLRAFDASGREYDGLGEARYWWSTNATVAYREGSDCFVQQYTGIEAAPGLLIDGSRTLDENILDSGGLLLALTAFRKFHGATVGDYFFAELPNITNEQLFFVGWAQARCETPATDDALRTQVVSSRRVPMPFGVDVPAYNVPRLAAVFDCSLQRECCLLFGDEQSHPVTPAPTWSSIWSLHTRAPWNPRDSTAAPLSPSPSRLWEPPLNGSDAPTEPPREEAWGRVQVADLFLTTLRRAPTANAEGLDPVGGWHRQGLGETRLQAPSDRYGSSAFAVGMLRDIEKALFMGIATGGVVGPRAGRVHGFLACAQACV